MSTDHCVDAIMLDRLNNVRRVLSSTQHEGFTVANEFERKLRCYPDEPLPGRSSLYADSLSLLHSMKAIMHDLLGAHAQVESLVIDLSECLAKEPAAKAEPDLN